MLVHSRISLYHMDLCPLVDLFVLQFLSLLFLPEIEKRAAEPLATQKIGNSWNICIRCIAHVYIFLSRIFFGEKCRCTLCSVCSLTHMRSGLTRISTHTFGCYLCALYKCFGFAAHVVDAHTHWWVEFLDSQIKPVAETCLSTVWKNIRGPQNSSEHNFLTDIWGNLGSPYLQQRVKITSLFFSRALSCEESRQCRHVFYVGDTKFMSKKLYLLWEQKLFPSQMKHTVQKGVRWFFFLFLICWWMNTWNKVILYLKFSSLTSFSCKYRKCSLLWVSA